MDRRAFLGTLAGGLLAAPLAAEAQPAEGLADRVSRPGIDGHNGPSWTGSGKGCATRLGRGPEHRHRESVRRGQDGSASRLAAELVALSRWM